MKSILVIIKNCGRLKVLSINSEEACASRLEQLREKCQVQLKNTHKYKGKAVQDGNETALGTLSAFT